MRAYLVAVPVLLTVHNLEEVLGGMGAAREALRGRLPASLGSLAGSPAAWLFAVVVLTVMAWLLILLGGLDRRDSLLARSLVVLQAGMALNVASHVGGSLLVGGYTGGLLSSVLLYIPFSWRFFTLAHRDAWVSPRFLRWSPVLALLLVPLLALLLALGAAVTS